MRNGRIRAVLFDLDGTLADTAPDLGGALNSLLAEVGRPPLAAAVFRPYVSAGTRGMLGVGFGIKPGHPDYQALADRFLRLYEQNICLGTVLFPGIPQLLSELDGRPISWGIVTNKPARFTLPLMEALGLSGRAVAIVSGDSTPNPKPAPDTILLACELAKVASDKTLYVGDDLRDMQAAKAAGAFAIAAAYGYLGTDTPIDAWPADYVIESPLEILDLL